MKLLFITHHYSHGGSIKMLTWLANSMCNFFEVYFCCVASDQKSYYSFDKRINVFNGGLSRNTSFVRRNTIDAILEKRIIENQIKTINPDVVINFGDHTLYSIAKLKRNYNFKLLLSQRVDPALSMTRRDKYRLGLYKYADGLVLQTQAVYDYFATIDEKKKKIIFNPVKTNPSFNWKYEKSENYIINVARIDLKQKRQDLLVKAFSIVREKHPDIILKLYGEDPNNEIGSLNDLIKELHLGNSVEYCGTTNDILKIISRAKCFVLSSDYEGIPNSVIEAMSVGTPVVCTDCKPDGGKLLIPNNNIGLLVERGNPNAIAEAIISIIENKEKSESLSENAKQSIKRFEEHKIINDWLEFINNI